MSNLAEELDWIAIPHRETASYDMGHHRDWIYGFEPIGPGKLWRLPERGASPPRQGVDVGRVFQELADEWKQDTFVTSSIHKKILHPAYQRIIGLGPAAVPYLISDLVETQADWFWALRAITGVNPVPRELDGDLREMIGCWLNWARSNLPHE